MNIVCAYCHIKGHHIKFCEELKEKNRRAATKQKVLSFQSQTVVVASVVAKQSIPKSKVNVFADLYSSEEEEEEGEIVEMRPKVRSDLCEDNAFSPFASLKTPMRPQESWLAPEPAWTRSGVKGVIIKMPESDSDYSMYSSDTDSEVEENPVLMAALRSLRDYVGKWDGMSWADVECESDVE